MPWPADLAGTPFQSDGFVAAFGTTRGRATASMDVLVIAEDDGKVCGLLPLAIFRRGAFRVARFPGGTHANANGWRLRAGFGPPRLSADALRRAAHAAGIRIDTLELLRVPDIGLFGAGFDIAPAPEERFAISLAGGIEAVIGRGNARRKKKKFRAQERHFETRGGYRCLDLPHEERGAALAVFAAQKRLRFRELGMPNPFSDKGIGAFLEALFTQGDLDARLYAIESGGVLKAMLGGIAEGETFWGMFSSFAEDEDAGASPGELLLWHLVERLSAEGLSVLDLGPGEERYKRSWCDRVVPQHDGLAVLTTAGRAYVAMALLRRTLVAAVKRNARLRAAAQKLRRLVRRG